MHSLLNCRERSVIPPPDQWTPSGFRLQCAIVSVCITMLLSGCRDASESVPGQTGATGPSSPQTVTVYSGRSEDLLGSILKQFESQTGIHVKVRYAGTSELAATISEEGNYSPADLFIAQDAGALGAVSALLSPLPTDILERVEPRFRSPQGMWVGLSGRARVVAYHTQRVQEEDLPESIWGFTEPKWKVRIGWPPTNGSFQAFVTALRVTEGEEKARQWLKAIQANQPLTYRNNTTIVQAIADGEIDVGFVNHYYLMRFLAEHGEEFPVRNWSLTGGDAGALINVAGAGILGNAKNREAAVELLTFLLSPEAQTYFAQETHEYPLAVGVEAGPNLVPLAEINSPEIDLSDLKGLEETLNLMRETGVLR